MNSLRDIAIREGLVAHIAPDTPDALTKVPAKHLFEGPHYDGKQCAVCQRKFKTAAEYVICRICKAPVCRRQGTCKGVHHATHRVAFLNAQKQPEVTA